MTTLHITKSDLDSDNKYKKGHIGTYDNFEDISIEIDENLGWRKILRLKRSTERCVTGM